ncbi:hypothetical protein PL11201_490090 [Planktothrix sp. PCC 11201]|uniref:hypothetical protein n=1 Tax=Planktothrix sp. PCC 11201 TaxID=1729650 RepID=UPI0009199CBF|nr:hypothetical protein [Planktothrix sp. PCC 11201]SKB12036.1 hypothetical protein PL11201_290004 [Planktothrix sp. PCC 11201]SKB13355.1 hypothetical protein PL11201_490090 [Planktothrix sp. PCC 11201]
MDNDIYDWTEVMGNNMITPTPRMVYLKHHILTRKTRLKREGKDGIVRPLRVKHDIHFVVWRIANVLKDFKSCDEEKLREVFELVIHEINSRGDANEVSE